MEALESRYVLATGLLSDFVTSLGDDGRLLKLQSRSESWDGSNEITSHAMQLTKVVSLPDVKTNVGDILQAGPLPNPGFVPLDPLGSLVYSLEVRNSIIESGEVDTLSVQLDAGQLITFSVVPRRLTTRISIEGPPENPISLAEQASRRGDTTMLSHFVEVAGTYTFSVDEVDNRSGTYTFNILINALAEQESRDSANDDPNTASDIDDGFVELSGTTAERAAVVGNIGNNVDEPDWYRFSVSDGQAFSVVSSSTSAEPPTFGLFDEVGTREVARSIPGENVDQSIRAFVDPIDGVTGEYWIRIAATSGQYNLVFTRGADFDIEPNSEISQPQLLRDAVALGHTASSDEPLTQEVEPNDDLGTANSLAGAFSAVGDNEYRAVVNGTVGSGASFDLDYFRFTASPGDSVRIDLQGFDSGMGTLGDPVLQLLDNAGNTLAFDDDSGNFLESLITFDSFPYAGDYYVVADSFFGDTGSYTLTLVLNTETPPISGDSDTFQFQATAGDTIELRTFTPGDGPFEPENLVDLALEVLDPNGKAIPHQNVPGNEALVIRAETSGSHIVRVSPQTFSQGAYVLSVLGQRHLVEPFFVSSSDTHASADLPLASPLEVTFDLSDWIRLDTLSAGDLLINGVSASGFAVNDGDTVTFDIRGLSNEGINTMLISAGSFANIRGIPIDDYRLEYVVDTQPPRVISSSIQASEVVSAGPTTITIGFDEPLSSTDLSSNDVSLVGSGTGNHSAKTFVYDPDLLTVTLSYGNLPDDEYRLTLHSGNNAFEDSAGNDLDGELITSPIPPNVSGDNTAGGDFSLRFSTDTITRRWSAPFQALAPLGSLIYESKDTGFIGVEGDVDRFIIDVPSHQQLSAVLETGSDLKGRLELFAPDGVSLGDSVADEAGTLIRLSAIDLINPGSYTIEVQAADDSTGVYNMHLLMNAIEELEEVSGVPNDLPTEAEDLARGFLPLLDGDVERAAVLGNTSASDDWYRFSLDEGKLASVVVESQSRENVSLEIYDSSGATLLARGTSHRNASNIVDGLADHTADGLPSDFLIRVRGMSTPYTLVITRESTFETEPNGSFENAQVGDHIMGAIKSGIDVSDVTVLRDFPGMDAFSTQCGCEPPDTHAAAGPDHIVEVVNTAIAMYFKDGTVATPPRELTHFFSASVVAGETFDFDPVVAYDELIDRWIVAALIAPSAFDLESDLLYAVSDSSDPTGPWTEQHRIDFSTVSPFLFADFPKISWNADVHVLTVNMFGFFDAAEVNVVAIDKASIVDGNPLTLDHIISSRPASSTLAPATMHASLPGDPMWFVEETDFFSFGGDSVHVVRMDDPLSAAPTYVDYEITVPPYDFPPIAEQPGDFFATNDSAILNVEYRGGRLVATHTIGVNGTAAVRWYDFDVTGESPLLIQNGTIDRGEGVHTYFPSIAINPHGDIGLTFMQSSADEFVSMYVAAQQAGGERGVMSTPILIRAGDETYFGFRGGDYSGITVDPTDGTFWAANEVSLAGEPNPQWSTWIAQFSTSDLADEDWYQFAAIAGDTIVVSTSTPLVVSGQDQLDPFIQLYGPDGSAIVVDDNSAPDGRNALLNHEILATGQYRIRVSAAGRSEGEYILEISGVSQSHRRPLIVASNPANGIRLTSFPSTLTAHFSQQLLLSTVEAADLTINGRPATGVVIQDGDTFQFELDPAANEGDGIYEVRLAAGAVLGLSGELNNDITRTFILDRAGPRILEITFNGLIPTSLDALEARDLTIAARFDEPLISSRSARKGWRTPSLDDVQLTDLVSGQTIRANSVSYDAQQLVFSATFTDLIETEYELRLLSRDDGFEDLVGNDLDGEAIGNTIVGTPTGDAKPGGDYILRFTTDVEMQLEEFIAEEPLGSLVFSGGRRRMIADVADVDVVRFVVTDDQPYSVVLQPHSETAVMKLNGTAAPGPGQPNVLFADATSAANTVALEVTADVRTPYDIAIYLGATVEDMVGDARDGNEVSLSGSQIPLALGSRSAIVGHADPIRQTTTLFFEDFSTGLGGFTSNNDFGTGGGLWHLSSGRSADGHANHSPPNSLYYGQNETELTGGDFDTGRENAGAVISPPIDLPRSGKIELHFNHFLDREPTSLADVAEVSVDTGFGFSPLLSTSDLTLTETAGVWIPITVDLSDFSGSKIRLRFTFDTIDPISNDFEGWFIDDISVVHNAETIPDIDEFVIDWNDSLAQPVDIVLSAHSGGDLADASLEILGPNGATVLASTTGGTDLNYDVGILDFIPIQPGTYTIRLTSTVQADYTLLVTQRLLFEKEPNDEANQARRITKNRAALGYLSDVPVLRFEKTNDPSRFIDISNSGQPLDLSDDGSASIDTHVGNILLPRGRVVVSNNGGVHASGGGLPAVNSELPSPLFATALLPLWDDLDDVTGNVYWEELQIDGVDALVVQWDDRSHFSAFGSPATFQLHLLASGPTLARFVYQDVVFGTAEFDFGGSATIGYQIDEQTFEQFSFNERVIRTGDVISLVQSLTDTYELRLTRGESETVTVRTQPAGSLASNLVPEINVLNPSGELLAITEITVGPTAQLSFAAPSTGLYSVHLTSQSGSSAYLVTVGDVVGDFNNDAKTNCTDVDLLSQMIVSMENDTDFDLNGDRQLDLDDLAVWLSLAAGHGEFARPFLLGDANLDGKIDEADLTVVGASWLQSVVGWCQGDFNADGIVDAHDLNKVGLAWLQDISAEVAAPDLARFPRAPLAHHVPAVFASEHEHPVLLTRGISSGFGKPSKATAEVTRGSTVLLNWFSRHRIRNNAASRWQASSSSHPELADADRQQLLDDLLRHW